MAGVLSEFAHALTHLRPCAQGKQSKALRVVQKANVALLRLHVTQTELPPAPLPVRLHVVDAGWLTKWRDSLEMVRPP